MEYGLPPPPPSAPPSTAAIARAIEIAALELTRSALSSPALEVSSRAPRHVRDQFLKASCAGRMSPEEVNSLVRSSCKAVHPLVQCVTAELRTVVDPRLERIRSGCNDMLKLRVADAVKAIRSPATAAISPAGMPSGPARTRRRKTASRPGWARAERRSIAELDSIFQRMSKHKLGVKGAE